MSGRGRIALLILVIWVGTLGWHVKRVHFVPVAQLVADAARTIPPGVSYYKVTQQDKHVGWAQSSIDTLPSFGGFRIRDRLEAELELFGEQIPTSVESEAVMSPTLAVQSFSIRSRGGLGDLQASGEIHGDSLLSLVFRHGSTVDSSEVRLEGPVALEAAWPLRLAAGRLRAGDRLRLPIFDPATGRTRSVELEVLAEMVTSFVDSVAEVGGRWVEARRDTVKAWLVRREVAGLKLNTRVDEDGRLLEAELPGGIRLERTAFELAYSGRPGRGEGGEGREGQSSEKGGQR